MDAIHTLIIIAVFVVSVAVVVTAIGAIARAATRRSRAHTTAPSRGSAERP